MMGATYPTKAALKAASGQPPRFVETSIFGPEYHGDGDYTVVGPSPHTRRWYATVTVRDGVIVKVK
jgi:hypothetical protein